MRKSNGTLGDRMKSLIALLFITTTATAIAHVAPGKYVGKDQNGKLCSFVVGEAFFENNLPHPLNERLPVEAIEFDNTTLAAQAWSLGHPPVNDIERGLVRFNHDLFQAFIATPTGGASVTIVKAPEKEEEKAPVSLIYINDVYRSKDQSKKLICTL